ncbi:NCS2 family permease [Alloiococcus sp. CFN-8]|uniref:NCS2 family permease n=1 Tax=Alloiococcus sp. CFN-8 TaxID=3416081 RepID=UPI003CF444C7
MDKIFHFTKEKTTIKQEVTAGLTVFFAVVYIIAVNSSILAEGGVPRNPAILATILASALGSIFTGLYSNTPLVMIPGMGVNALFSYTIVNTMGLSWESALGAVLISGILFAIVAFTPLWRILMTSIPESLKTSITVGIGLFLALLGLQKSGVIIPSPTGFGTLGNLASMEVLAALLTFIIALFLYIRNVSGNFLLTILIGTIISFLFGVNSFDFNQNLSFSLTGYNEVFMKFSLKDIGTIPFWIASISFALVLIFSNMGVINAYVGEMLSSPNKFHKSFKANAVSALTCGFLGTSPTVTAAESAAGIAVGGKTGLTSVIAGLLFLLCIPIIPLVSLIPDLAVAPVFIIIGLLMVQNITKIDFSDYSEGIASFLTIILIPFTSDIVTGMGFGFIAYPLLKIISSAKRDISPALYIIALLFVLNFVFTILY